MKQQLKRLPGFLKKRIRQRDTIIKGVMVLILLALFLFDTSQYIETVSTSVGFDGSNYSNPITATEVVRVRFTPTERITGITLPLVEPEQDTENGIRYAVYTAEGATVTVGEFTHAELYASHFKPTIKVKGLKQGQQYILALEGLGQDAAEGYRLVVGGYYRSDFDEFTWADSLEQELPWVDLEYRTPRWRNLLVPAGCIGLMLFFMWVPPLQGKKQNAAIAGVLLLFMPLVLVYAVESCMWYGIGELSFWSWVLNYLLYMFVILLVFVLANRVWAGVGIGGGILVAGGIINAYTLLFRGTVVLPTDILATGTALSVAGSYTWEVSPRVYIAVFVLLFCIAASLGNTFRLKGGRVRLAAAGVVALYAFGMVQVSRLENKQLQQIGLLLNKYTQNTNARLDGFYLNFVLNVKDLFLQKPNGYNMDTLRRELEKYEQDMESGRSPHIVLILNESLVDLNTLTGLETDEDPLPFIHTLGQDDTSFVGSTVVSVFGGSTSVSEFEVLGSFSSALSYNDMAPMYVYMRNARVPSVAQTLGQLGYHTIGIHPENGSNWNRNSAYPRMGIEEGFFIEDFRDLDMDINLRQYTSDEMSFQFVINQFEEKAQDGPLFIFNVTMQNHGGHAVEDFEAEIAVTNLDANRGMVEQYLTSIKYTDIAFEGLLDYFQNQEEPVLVVMFGDHWPNLGDEFTNPVMELRQHEYPSLVRQTTPYIVWSNYGADLSGLPEQISLNYLMPYVKQAAGISLTPFEQFLIDISEQYPVISQYGILDAAGNYYDPQEYATLSDMFVLYDSLEYNGWFDTKNRIEDWFFYAVQE